MITDMAAELAINPGLCETTMTWMNPMTATLTTETKTGFVKGGGFGPGDLFQDMEGRAA